MNFCPNQETSKKEMGYAADDISNYIEKAGINWDIW